MLAEIGNTIFAGFSEFRGNVLSCSPISPKSEIPTSATSDYI